MKARLFVLSSVGVCLLVMPAWAGTARPDRAQGSLLVLVKGGGGGKSLPGLPGMPGASGGYATLTTPQLPTELDGKPRVYQATPTQPHGEEVVPKKKNWRDE